MGYKEKKKCVKVNSKVVLKCMRASFPLILYMYTHFRKSKGDKDEASKRGKQFVFFF